LSSHTCIEGSNDQGYQ